MGGSIAVTLRMPSGEEYRMRRWTNPLSWFFNNIKFFEKDPAHIQEYLEQWFEMKADWEKNRDTGDYQLNMTQVYAPYPAPLAPHDYGIVVFDFMKNVVVSCQGYTSFVDPHLAYKRLDDERYQAQLELLERGRIKKLSYYDGECKEVPVPATRQELEALREKHRMMDVEYDTSPFVIHDVGEGYTDSLKAKQLILDLGFRLTEEDEKGWKEWGDHWKEILAEEEDDDGDEDEPEEYH